MGETSWPAVRRMDVDGIPLLWADAPPPVEAELLFRVGRADETLATSGLTHLVEHLAMPAGRPAFECNAWVGDSVTGFHARGTEAEVAGFLADTVARLQALPLDRLDVEKRILQAEESQNGPDPVAGLLGVRFGARGFGLAGGEQLGLRRIGGEDVASWTERFFTRGNAVLWVRGPLPELRVALPDGERRPPPAARPVEWQALPAAAAGWPDGVWASLLGPPETPFLVACSVLEDRLTQRLRYETGLVYAVETRYGPLNGDVFHSALWAQCPPDRTEAVRDVLLEVTDGLAAAGPTRAELERDADAYRRAARDPAALTALVGSTAIDVLLGRPLVQPSEYAAQLQAVTPEDVAAALAEALRTAVVALPGDLAMPEGRFAAVADVPALPPVEGRVFKRSWLAFGARRERLVVGPEGLTLTHADGVPLTIRFDACAAALAWPDGTRGLWGEHGFYVEIWPVHWRHGHAAVAAIDEGVPPGVVLPMTLDDPRRLDPAAAATG